MRMSREEMDKSHRRILLGAAALFRERGLEMTTVSDVMQRAGMTNGGFYRHFQTKEELVVASINLAFEQTLAYLSRAYENTSAREGLERFCDFYLSKQHIDNPGLGCPIAAFGAEIARQTAAVRTAFANGLERIVTEFVKGEQGPVRDRRRRAVRRLAMLSGAVMMARACDSAVEPGIHEEGREFPQALLSSPERGA